MGINNGEIRKSPEFEQKSARIKLEFFRHDDKGKAATDEQVRLTPKGREHASEVGKIKNPQPKTAIAFGSTRERAVETSMRHMLANEDTITPEMSMEDMRAEIARFQQVGKKDKTLPKLNFDWDSNQNFHDTAYPRFLETKDALVFLKEDSDHLVKDNKDLTSDSYSRSAGNFAEFVLKYLKILPRWKQLTNEQPEKYGKFDNEMQRFFGTHQTVSEPFLMKVIEKTEGQQAVKLFLNSLKSKNGFDLSEGYTVTIEDHPDKPRISVEFRGKTWHITQKTLEEIVSERNKLNDSIMKDVR